MPTRDPSSLTSMFDTTELVKIGQKQIDALIEMQRELCNSLEQVNQSWASRAELEREVTAECTSKLLRAKNLPEVVTAYEEWMGRHTAALADDGRKLLANNEKLTATASKILSSNGFSAST